MTTQWLFFVKDNIALLPQVVKQMYANEGGLSGLRPNLGRDLLASSRETGRVWPTTF